MHLHRILHQFGTAQDRQDIERAKKFVVDASLIYAQDELRLPDEEAARVMYRPPFELTFIELTRLESGKRLAFLTRLDEVGVYHTRVFCEYHNGISVRDTEMEACYEGAEFGLKVSLFDGQDQPIPAFAAQDALAFNVGALGMMLLALFAINCPAIAERRTHTPKNPTRKNGPPLFEHETIRLSRTVYYDVRAFEGDSEEAKYKRLRWVRGHIRRVETGIVWVRPHLLGRGDTPTERLYHAKG